MGTRNRGRQRPAVSTGQSSSTHAVSPAPLCSEGPKLRQGGNHPEAGKGRNPGSLSLWLPADAGP